MTGFIRNLFGTYQIYDTPDYEDLVPKLLAVEKWAAYGSSGVAVFNILFSKNPPKGFFPITNVAFRCMAPVMVTGATFVGTLYASARLRGNKNDEYNSMNATIVSGAMFHYLSRLSPWTFIQYFLYVGFATNMYKQSALYNWTLVDDERLMKNRKFGFISGPYLFDWSIHKELPPKWVNADDLSDEERAKVKIAA